MPLPKPPFKGSCLCGAVEVDVTGPPLLTVVCHCSDCQKLTASAFSLTTMFPSETFSCSRALIEGGLKSSGRKHYYCESCLGFVYSQVKGAEHRINLRTSILDNAHAFEPFVEVMAEDKTPWATVPVARSYETFPQSLEELTELMEDYAKS